jgi:chromosome segregation ATPase
MKKAKPDYKLLHKLRRQYARMTRDDLILVIHDLEKQRDSLYKRNGYATQALGDAHRQLKAVEHARDTHFAATEEQRKKLLVLEKELNLAKSERDGYRNETTLLKGELDAMEDQRDILIDTLGRLK